MSTESVYDLHQKQIEDGHSHIAQTVPLVDIIGGIDRIVTDYLTKTLRHELILNSEQLAQVNDAIGKRSRSRTSRASKFNRHKTRTKITDNVNTNASRVYNDEEYVYYFYDDDTLLMKSNCCKKRSKFVYVRALQCMCSHQLYVVFLILTYAAYSVVSSFESYEVGTLVHSLYSIPLICVLWLPFAIYLLMSVNRVAMKLIVSTFDFWVKVGAIFVHFVVLLIDIGLRFDEWEHAYLLFLERFLYGFLVISGVTNISLMEGLQLKRWVKLSFLSVFGCAAVFNSIKIALDVPPYTDTILVSLNSLKVSTLRLLAVFIWRQCIMLWIKPNQAAAGMEKSPFIVWNVRPSKATNVASLVGSNSQAYHDHRQRTFDGDQDDDGAVHTNCAVTREQLYELHTLQVQDQMNKNRYIPAIVDVIGGIDAILADYLDTDAEQEMHALNETQLHELHTILKKATQMAAIRRSKQDTVDTNIYYFFDAEDSLLSDIASKKIANSVVRIFRSMAMQIFLYVCILFYVALVILIDSIEENYEKWLVMTVVVNLCVFIPYEICTLLNLNKAGFLFSIQRFDFWMKMVYAIMLVVSAAIDELYFNPEQYTDYGVSLALGYLEHVVFSITVLLFIVCIACLDASTLARKKKIFILSACMIWGCYISVSWTFFWIPTETESSHAAVEMKANGARVVTVFIGRQLLWTCCFKTKAALIRYTPKVQWYVADTSATATATATTTASVQ